MLKKHDSIRATTGVDPVTGRKLSDAERVAAGAMAAAGFIPVVGWAGRAIKGGAAIVKTAKGINTANHMLDAYKGTKAMDILNKTEKGIYGLYTPNSAWEFGSGRDMFGNKLTEEQRQQALWNGLTMGAAGAGARFIDNGGLQKLGSKFPYSTNYVKNKLVDANNALKQIGCRAGSRTEDAFRSMRNSAGNIGNRAKDAVNQVKKKVLDMEVPTPRVYSTAGGPGMPGMPIVNWEKQRLGDMMQRMDSNGIQGGASRETSKRVNDVDKVLSRNGSFRDAKRRAGIPNSSQPKKPVVVFDGTSENRIVYEFEVNGKKKYIIEHREDKFGRGPHFHGADDLKGSPLNKGRYNQYPGHSPEDFDGYKKKGHSGESK